MKLKSTTIIILLLAAILGVLLYNNCNSRPTTVILANDNTKQLPQDKKPATTTDIAALTAENIVIPYLKQHHRLPDCYITKTEARSKGWVAAQQNLCDVLPGRAIGGDIFTNREKKLPTETGRRWKEADLNYNCNGRNADRVLFSSDGLIYTTHDHYKTFQQQ